MNRNIIFLDIDGVLNSYHFFYNKFTLFLDKIFKLRPKTETKMISKWRLLLVSILCKIKSCDIVLSTSWRALWDENLIPIKECSAYKVDRLFKLYGLNIIGKTPRGIKALKNNYEIILEDGYLDVKNKKYWRGSEILEYIETHNLQLDKCIIIDDGTVDIECYPILRDRIIKTEYYNGIGGFKIKELIKSLKLLR